MRFWIMPLTLIVSVGAALAVARLKIPRDLTQEKLDDRESLQAYDRVSHRFFFSWIRYYVTRQITKLHPQGILLDAGCGPGYLALSLAQEMTHLEIMGIDVMPATLEYAVRNRSLQHFNPQVQFQNASIQQLPFIDNSIDFVVSTLALHHWSAPDLAFSEIYRVLKPGGQFLIFDLRRDMPRLLFLFIHLGQNTIAPPSIRRVNGGVGSVWSSYTPLEIQSLLTRSPFRRWSIIPNWGWIYIWGRKT